METHKPNTTDCDGGCPGCAHDPGGDLPEGALSGWKLVGTVGGAFLLPLGLAILGAVLAGTQPNRQVLGALIGLVSGLALAVLAAAVLKHRTRTPRKDTP